ncbi:MULTISPECIES: hypothetical protein [unclassified Moorena]|uniref:hypothetical protein n=1 Tax=unclassified Moorena TaxID=2683338 RepID=UPI0013FEFFF1|nr:MULTISPECIES: hypothetical protein [unclassified Moorena]NEO12829.1 hypothetical protein [Moorena sp. SIO3E8]NEQ01657.1 hypothetical protein [Moorena sp. SIO3F7]
MANIHINQLQSSESNLVGFPEIEDLIGSAVEGAIARRQAGFDQDTLASLSDEQSKQLIGGCDLSTCGMVQCEPDDDILIIKF